MWEYHDNKMRELKKLYNKISKQTQNELQELLDTFNFTLENLYSIVDTKTKTRLNEYIEDWKEKKLLTGYFGVLANNIYNKKRVKNSEILELLIYYVYIHEQSKLDNEEQQIMYDDVNYHYKQGFDEVNETLENKKSFSVMEMALFLALLNQATYNGYTYKQNIQATMQYNVQQIYKQAIYNIQQEKEIKINSSEFQRLINQQNNQRLCINGNKISGAIDLITIGLDNQAKIEGIKESVQDKTQDDVQDNTQVRFIAVEDEKTTEMCQSLNNQLFYVNKENTFDRYYGETAKDLRIERIRCNGLVLGLNLPPIQHHFHFCRSTIMYVANKKEKEYNINSFLYVEKPNKSKHINFENDYEKIAKEYQRLPENVKKFLYNNGVKIKWEYNRDTSGYDREKKEILLRPNIENGELTHEIGHAIYYLKNVKSMKSYQDIVNKIFDSCQNSPKEIISRSKNFYALDTTFKVNNDFQVYIGESQNTQYIIQNIVSKNLPELFSEAYREYYNKKEQDVLLNKLVEEVEKIC